MTIEVREVSDFSKVRLRGPGILKVTQSDHESLTIQAPRYGISQLQSIVVDEELLLGYVSIGPASLQLYREVITYDLHVKDLCQLCLTGVGRAVLPDMDSDVLVLQVKGAGEIRVDHLTADRLEVLIDGRGRVSVSGDVEAQSVVVRDAGDYQAETMISDFASLNVTGPGRAAISVNDRLRVAITGHGTVSYAGFPEIVKLISGSGRLQRHRQPGLPLKRGIERS
jgi:hypothetical protein